MSLVRSGYPAKQRVAQRVAWVGPQLLPFFLRSTAECLWTVVNDPRDLALAFLADEDEVFRVALRPSIEFNSPMVASRFFEKCFGWLAGLESSNGDKNHQR